MNLNCLPDLCLIKILSPFSIKELFSLKLVCHRWNSLIPSVFRQKQKLRIFGRNNQHFNSNVNHLSCDRLPFFGVEPQFDLVICFNNPNFDDTNANLLSLFPNVTHFALVNFEVGIESQKNVVKVLSNWPKLNELKLVGLRNANYNWNLFSSVLNQLKRLRNLSIDVNISRLKDLSIYGQLKQIYCRYILADRVELNLLRYLPSLLIGKNIEQCGFYVEDNGMINCLSPSEAIRLTRLAVKVGFLSQLKLLSAKFSTIRYLDLTFYDNESTIESFLACLSQLRVLTELKLFLSPLHNYFMKITKQNLKSLPKLTSIKQVELQFPIDPHKFGWIETIFPNADQLMVVGQFLFVDFEQLLCDQCANCIHIQGEIDKCDPGRLDVSLKFRFKNGNILH